MSATWRQLQRKNKQITTMITEYRVEVSTRHLPRQQQEQFIQAAQAGGYTVASIHNGYTLAITGLTEERAIKIRDGLAEFAIHCSIGIGELKR